MSVEPETSGFGLKVLYIMTKLPLSTCLYLQHNTISSLSELAKTESDARHMG